MSFHEILIAVMAAFAVAGAIDRIFGNRWGLGKEFEEGILAMGSLALAMVGIVCLAPVLANLLKPVIVPVFAFLGADPAMFAGTILACDMGGGALAVDREGFARMVTESVLGHPNITMVPGEVTAIPEGNVVIASGPLTSDALADAIAEKLGGGHTLNFFDAAAPLVTFDSVDMDSAYFASRYDKGTPDYINCPMTKEEYQAFWAELVKAEEAEVHGFEDSGVFEGCMPVEVMARRGEDTLRFGPLKPRGLVDPKTGREPYAVVQLRQDNAAKSVYNLVGFQTHLKFGEQKRVFSMIPGLENAEFVRYGVMHQNTFLQSPKLLDKYYADRRNPLVAFAGQMTGVEGYVESTASGYLAAVAMAAKVQGREVPDFPKETAIGALGQYVSDESIENFQPMNINFSIIAPLEKRIRKKAEKNLAIAARSLDVIDRLVAKGI